MLRDIVVKVIEHLNLREGLRLQTDDIEVGQQSGYYWTKIVLENGYYLQLNSYYYFKTYQILLRVEDENYETESSSALRESLQKSFPDSSVENWYVVGISSDKRESNRWGGSYLDLFRVYKKPEESAHLCEKFCDVFGQRMRILVDAAREAGN